MNGPDASSHDARLPDFVVIGAQKSASSFLQTQLAQHPDIELAPGETRLFEDPHYSPEGVAALPQLFSRSTARRGIKRPDYLGHPEVPARLRADLPDVKLMAVLRDPISRAVSSYFHFVRHGFVPLTQVDDAIDAVLTGTWNRQYPRAAEILEYGRYGHHLSRYLQHIEPERLLLFEQRQLIDHPVPSLRRAFEFLDVDPNFIPEVRKVSNKGVYAPARLRLLRTRNRMVFDYTPGLERRDPRDPHPLGWLYDRAIVGVDRLVLSRFDDGRPPAISDTTRRRLQDYYASDFETLRSLLPRYDVVAPWAGELRAG